MMKPGRLDCKGNNAAYVKTIMPECYAQPAATKYIVAYHRSLIPIREHTKSLTRYRMRA